MKRIVSLLSHMRGRRGMLLTLATLSGVGWWLLGEHPLTPLFAMATIGLAAVLVLLVSVAISETHRDLRRLSQTVAKGTSVTRESEMPDTITREYAELAQSLSALRGAPQHQDGPAITVVIPAFNEGRFIAECIASVKHQSFEDWECLVVDDASTDRTLAIASAAIAGDRRFRVIRHRVNGGLSASRNTGLREANAELITFLDGDDLLMRDSLLDRYVAFQAHSPDAHVAGSYCGVVNAPEDAKLDDFPPHEKWGTRWKSRDVVDFITSKGECPFSAHSPLLRTEPMRRIGGFDEAITSGGEDWDLWVRIMRNGYIFVPASFRTAIYRQKLGSMIRASVAEHALISAGLIRQAHRPADAAAFTHPSPTPMTKPLWHYQEAITVSARLLRFAATAIACGRSDVASQILSSMPDLPEPIVRRHIDVERQFVRGVERALGYTGTNSDVIAQASATLFSDFDRLVSSVFGPAEATPAPIVEVIESLLIPQHSGHLREMLNSTPSSSLTTVLLIDREAGDQGVRKLPEGVKALSLNQLVLQGPHVNEVVVGGVREAVVDGAAQMLAERGAVIREVREELDPIMAVDAAPDRDLWLSSGSMSADAPTLAQGLEWPAEPFRLHWEGIAEEETYNASFDARSLASFKDIHRGERAVIIGNGPSLNRLDLRLLKNEATFAVNAIFLAQEQMGFDPMYYVVEDTAVMADNLEQITAYSAGHKFFPSIYRDLVGDHPNVTYFMMNRGFYSSSSPNYCVPRFATDVAQQIFCGQSVTIINLQLAYHMGFSEIVMIGMDFSYVIPADAEVEGNIITSRSGDPNHFHPDYFGPGKVWKDPKLDRVLASYALAKDIYEADGRKILNATPGGNLELFDRVSYEAYFS